MLGEIPPPANIDVSPQITDDSLQFDGSQVPYWLGGTQGTITEAVTSVGPVMVPANTPANKAASSGVPVVAGVNAEDFFTGDDPYFFIPVIAPLAPPAATSKNNTLLYVGIAAAAFLLFKK